MGHRQEPHAGQALAVVLSRGPPASESWQAKSRRPPQRAAPPRRPPAWPAAHRRGRELRNVGPGAKGGARPASACAWPGHTGGSDGGVAAQQAQRGTAAGLRLIGWAPRRAATGGPPHVGDLVGRPHIQQHPAVLDHVARLLGAHIHHLALAHLRARRAGGSAGMEKPCAGPGRGVKSAGTGKLSAGQGVEQTGETKHRLLRPARARMPGLRPALPGLLGAAQQGYATKPAGAHICKHAYWAQCRRAAHASALSSRVARLVWPQGALLPGSPTASAPRSAPQRRPPPAHAAGERTARAAAPPPPAAARGGLRHRVAGQQRR